MMTLIRGDALDSRIPDSRSRQNTCTLHSISDAMLIVNLVYAGRFGVNLCGVDARLLVRSFIERELVPSPRESTRPWRLAS